MEYDEVRLYDRVLSAGEVLGNFEAGPNNINNTDIPVTIVTPPASVTVDETGSATFRTAFAGSSPVTIQWLRNGAEIAGATNFTYTLNNVTSADSGATFSARISNTVNGAPVTVTTGAATLTVQSPTVTLKGRRSSSACASLDVIEPDSGGFRGPFPRGDGLFSSLGDGTVDEGRLTWHDLSGSGSPL